MSYTSRDIVNARIEELIFALDVVHNQDNPKLMLSNKLDDLLNMVKEKNNE